MKIFHVWGKHWRLGDVLYGTFSTKEKADAYVNEIKNSGGGGYNYSIDVEESELDVVKD